MFYSWQRMKPNNNSVDTNKMCIRSRKQLKATHKSFHFACAKSQRSVLLPSSLDKMTPWYRSIKWKTVAHLLVPYQNRHTSLNQPLCWTLMMCAESISTEQKVGKVERLTLMLLIVEVEAGCLAFFVSNPNLKCICPVINILLTASSMIL